MHPYLGNWIAIARAVMDCVRAAYALGAVIKCRHCRYMFYEDSKVRF